MESYHKSWALGCLIFRGTFSRIKMYNIWDDVETYQTSTKLGWETSRHRPVLQHVRPTRKSWLVKWSNLGTGKFPFYPHDGSVHLCPNIYSIWFPLFPLCLLKDWDFRRHRPGVLRSLCRDVALLGPSALADAAGAAGEGVWGAVWRMMVNSDINSG